MRKIEEIIIHCSATPEGRKVTVEDIDEWHCKRGFKCIGYHYVIYLDGSIHKGRDESVVGAHCSKHNAKSIGICYIGGCEKVDKKLKPKDTRTPEQKASLIELIQELAERYPNATLHGHNEFADKECPCFDVQDEYGALYNSIENRSI